MADHAFKNGADIHFDYNGIPPVSTTSKKKKKRKSKSKKSQQDSDAEGNSQHLINTPQAHLNNPDEDYPTSRVIKQAPNGDVIVESLDESNSSHKHNPHGHDHKHDFLHNSIWDSATIEEQENLKLFWESLDEPQKMQLVRIDKNSIMEIFKNETRASINNSHHNNNNGASSNNPQSNSLFNNNCTCSFCGRRSNIIEDELENIYDNHFDDIIDFIHEVRDINDLNALPGLLFGGFHMLEEEHKLQKRNRYKNNQAQQRHIQENGHSHDSHDHLHDHHDHDHSHLDHHHDHDHDTYQHNHDHELENPESDKLDGDVVRPLAVHPSTQHRPIVTQESKHKIDKINEINETLNFTKKEKIEEIQLKKALDEDFNANLHQQISSHSKQTSSGELSNEQKIFNKLLDPKLVEALENLDLEKMKMDVSSTLVNNENINQANLLQKAGSLKEILKDLHKADKVQLEKGMSFLQNMGNIFSSTAAGTTSSANGSLLPPNTVPGKFNDQLTQGLSSFAEDLLKNDGHSFIDMMESLSESRTAREDILKGSSKKEVSAAWVDEDDSRHLPGLSEIVETEGNAYEEYEEDLQRPEETDEYSNDEVVDEDDLEEEDIEHDDELDDEENEEGASDTESEISEEEKMQEIRRLFLIQVIKLFQERLKNAYKEKLSKDRTQMLIEELEAEENAKKERELKKLKQREKAREKKKLQQQAKEEEKKKKEEEQRLKEEEELKKQEVLKAEQRRRKEEQRLKKEEEKKKRIEELKRKEEEHRKKVEAQIKKEEEAKKIKEERRKKAEEERKKREEEKKQKELMKKQREEERALQKLEREKYEEQERLQLDAEAQEINAAEISQKAAFSAVDEFELDPKPLSPTKASPSKNHLLEQLYQARPNSISSASGSGLTNIPNIGTLPESGFVPSVISPVPANILPNQSSFTNGSPSTHNNLLYGQGLVSGTISPWSSKSRLNSISNPSSAQKNLFQPQLSNNFSPFNTSFNAEQPLVNDPFNTAISAPGQDASIGWGQSRNNSIWSTTPAANSIWGNNAQNSGTVNPIANSIPSTPSSSIANTASNPINSIPDALIQTAAYNAFRLLQNTNQLEFGVVPLLKLFQTTKDVLVQPSLTLNQFLVACRSSSTYQFDLIYDDFGTVTHIKVSEHALTQQYAGYPPAPAAPFGPTTNGPVGVNPIAGNSAFRTSPPPALNGAVREDFLGFDGIGNSVNRGLWN